MHPPSCGEGVTHQGHFIAGGAFWGGEGCGCKVREAILCRTTFSVAVRFTILKRMRH